MPGSTIGRGVWRPIREEVRHGWSLVRDCGGGSVPRGGRGVTRDGRSGGRPFALLAGAHTLAPPGSHLYPDTGNGGYTSLHTLVHLVYDANRNLFLPGNRVVLTDRATKCLTSFSLDFERRSANTGAGPDMQVGSVRVNGRPARFSFVQPTYPGDPNGQNDPNPAAHEASQTNSRGRSAHNPLPPACSPELLSTGAGKDSLNGTQCPANKLVITPRAPLPEGAAFTVTVAYTGRPGVHNDGDGTTEGWFRAHDGGFVTTEPVGSEDWMPLNDYPAAKPTYDFSDTVTAGRTVIANGILVSVGATPRRRVPPRLGHVELAFRRAHRQLPGRGQRRQLPADRAHRAAASRFYQAQDTAISAARRKKNLAIMRMQLGITKFESRFTGAYPFTSDGIVIGTPQAGFDEEMETMIAFAGGEIDTDTLYHENMHQWWGDNVTESGYRMTFFKEGMATVAEFLYHARLAENAAGGPSSPKRPGGLPGEPGAPVQRDLRKWGRVLDGGALEPRAVRTVLGRGHLLPPRCRVSRAAPDPRPRQLHRRAARRSSAPMAGPASANPSSKPCFTGGCPCEAAAARPG